MAHSHTRVRMRCRNHSHGVCGTVCRANRRDDADRKDRSWLFRIRNLALPRVLHRQARSNHQRAHRKQARSNHLLVLRKRVRSNRYHSHGVYETVCRANRRDDADRKDRRRTFHIRNLALRLALHKRARSNRRVRRTLARNHMLAHSIHRGDAEQNVISVVREGQHGVHYNMAHNKKVLGHNTNPRKPPVRHRPVHSSCYNRARTSRRSRSWLTAQPRVPGLALQF